MNDTSEPVVYCMIKIFINLMSRYLGTTTTTTSLAIVAATTISISTTTTPVPLVQLTETVSNVVASTLTGLPGKPTSPMRISDVSTMDNTKGTTSVIIPYSWTWSPPMWFLVVLGLLVVFPIIFWIVAIIYRESRDRRYRAPSHPQLHKQPLYDDTAEMNSHPQVTFVESLQPQQYHYVP